MFLLKILGGGDIKNNIIHSWRLGGMKKWWSAERAGDGDACFRA